MPKVASPEQLFVHELKDMYYAEKALTKVLPRLATEATDRELSKVFTRHLDETRDQDPCEDVPGEVSEEDHQPDEHGYPENHEDGPRANGDHAYLGRRHRLSVRCSVGFSWQDAHSSGPFALHTAG